MLRRFREFLTLFFISLLPFHALFVTAGTKLLLGPGHAPMPMLAVWKEGLLALICLIAFVEILRRITNYELRITNIIRCDLIDCLILALLALALFLPKTNFLFGFKYDFIPLIAFMILRRVEWSDHFKVRAESALLIVGGIVALYGIITFFLPEQFFYALGYSDAHSLYLPDGPLAAVQQISGTGIRRIQSTMSGPNQLGIWLLIPWSIGVVHLVRRKNALLEIYAVCTAVIGLGIILTFSRSAWIAAAVIGCVALYRVYARTMLTPKLFGAAWLLIFGVIIAAWLSPAVFVRSISLAGHIERPLQAINVIKNNPLGLGLGSAGPAANRTHDVCVFLSEGDDASWAAINTDLCVFAGKTQVTTGRACDCPLIPENWYLQIGAELGMAGFLLYLALIGSIFWRLRKIDVAFLMFLGIGIAALFLHAWEDAAVAYTGWIIIAGIIHPWFRKAPSSSSTSAGNTRI
ncbi:MAG: hypothetical protein HOO67_05705 [Candidatus Peribacteraceae bacterium]|nr:hypothetical protein [Candidatus Peribacteraceae bacterium]